MTTLTDGMALGRLVQPRCRLARDGWRARTHRRMSQVFEGATEAPFDDSSRIIFFSDLHRGDNSRADSFAPNKELFAQVLRHYNDQGFTYIEVGDGDELWKNWRVNDIYRAHAPIFDLMHRFDRDGRLHLIVGNHDLRTGRQQSVEKAGIEAREALILRHTKTAQRLFVVHGHQVDFWSEYLCSLSRFVVRRFWKRLQLMGLVPVASSGHESWTLHRIERAILGWVKARQQIVICGHTHRPMVSALGAPYFNTGACVFPRFITGLELVKGEIRLVRWSQDTKTRQGLVERIERKLVAPPTPLTAFAW